RRRWSRRASRCSTVNTRRDPTPKRRIDVGRQGACTCRHASRGQPIGGRERETRLSTSVAGDGGSEHPPPAGTDYPACIMSDQNGSTVKRGARRAFAVGSWLLFLAILGQFLLARLEIFASGGFLSYHASIDAAVVAALALLL